MRSGRGMSAYAVLTAVFGLAVGTRWVLRAAPDPFACVLAVWCASALALWCAALGSADLHEYRLPDCLTLPGAAVICAAAWASGCVQAAFAGGLLLAAMYAVLRAVRPRSLGAGDVKLALGLGAATACAGGSCWALAAAGGPVVTILVGLSARVAGRRRFAPRAGPAVFPHGVSMCLASLLALAVAG